MQVDTCVSLLSTGIRGPHHSTSYRRYGQGSLSALRAILAGLCNLQFLRVPFSTVLSASLLRASSFFY